MTSIAGWTYVYDGDSQRVIKCSGTYPTCSTATLYWPGASGTLDETGWTGTFSEEYIFFNGQRVARRSRQWHLTNQLFHIPFLLGLPSVSPLPSEGIRSGNLDPKLANSISYLGAGFMKAQEFPVTQEADSDVECQASSSCR
jgi:hypothetical protein